tara:strand:- start:413 stop:2206 length:1794 start_codon:yes stop_codon:yes gene_type:complete
MSQQETKDMAKHFYRASAADFMKIPGSPIAYSASDEIRLLFEHGLLSDFVDTRLGMATADNSRFLRLWHEVSQRSCFLYANSRDEAQGSMKRWFPYQKGGDFRKWYGNNDYFVNWENDGYEIQNFRDEVSGKVRSHNYNLDYIFSRGVTWNALTSGKTSARISENAIFDNAGSSLFVRHGVTEETVMAMINSKVMLEVFPLISPTLNYQPGDLSKLPAFFPQKLQEGLKPVVSSAIAIEKLDWDSYENSWNFVHSPLLDSSVFYPEIASSYSALRSHWLKSIKEMRRLEQEINSLFIDSYGLKNELTPEIPLDEVSLTCNPDYRYGSKLTFEEKEARLQSDTLAELMSYAIGCMMGRYSLDKPGLILASQGETLHDYLQQVPSPRFAPDDDAILPLTDQEWFADDATNRFQEFVRVVWGKDNLQENLDFVAESLCLHAIKPKRGESALDTIRRYLSTQFYKDHLRTYKKRPIYWLFSSGKHKAFECLVYLHRYNEGTLARMRTEYVIPLSAKLNAYAEKLEQDQEASTSAAETKRLEKEIATLHKQQAELAEFDEKLRHYADQRISLDLDDGVKVNYGKFGDLLAEVKAVTGEKPSD